MKKNLGGNDTKYPGVFGELAVTKQQRGNPWQIGNTIHQGLIRGVKIRPGLSLIEQCACLCVCM